MPFYIVFLIGWLSFGVVQFMMDVLLTMDRKNYSPSLLSLDFKMSLDRQNASLHGWVLPFFYAFPFCCTHLFARLFACFCTAHLPFSPSTICGVDMRHGFSLLTNNILLHARCTHCTHHIKTSTIYLPRWRTFSGFVFFGTAIPITLLLPVLLPSPPATSWDDSGHSSSPARTHKLLFYLDSCGGDSFLWMVDRYLMPSLLHF